MPTVLVPNERSLRERLSAIGKHFSRAQLDVLNNTFVPHKSFPDPDVIETINPGITFEIDLMVDMNDYDLAQWNRRWVNKIAFHVEATHDVASAIKTVLSFGKKVFLSLSPDTELEAVEPYVKTVNGVLFLSVVPGKSGNPFQPQVVEKVRAFRTRHRSIEVEVDGGVNNETLGPLIAAGINGAAVGSYLENEKMEERSLELLAIAEQGVPGL